MRVTGRDRRFVASPDDPADQEDCHAAICGGPHLRRTALQIAPNADGVRLLGAVADQNGKEGVILVRSFLGEDRTYTFCIFDAPDPGADPQVRESQRAAG
jgi:hypothetical protein